VLWPGAALLVTAAIIVALLGFQNPGATAALKLVEPSAASYSPVGAYVGPLWPDATGFKVAIASDGLPRVRYSAGYQVNPVTIEQYGLWAYGRLRTPHRTSSLRIIRHVAEWLVANQGRDGAWTYGFDFREYSWHLSAPWESALAQGQAMSLLERAYRLTHRAVYLRAAERALRPLESPVQDGGLRDCFHGDCGKPFYEEYPTQPAIYVLNGFMFALLGLYDLASVQPRSRALSMYRAGLRTLHAVLPLYDHQGTGVYALSDGKHPVISPYYYQALHINLLRALNRLHPDRTFVKYGSRWEQTLRSAAQPWWSR
jgi:heparosan-N-sulfate-glucuronate 5-epimerase